MIQGRLPKSQWNYQVPPTGPGTSPVLTAAPSTTATINLKLDARHNEAEEPVTIFMKNVQIHLLKYFISPLCERFTMHKDWGIWGKKHDEEL